MEPKEKRLLQIILKNNPYLSSEDFSKAKDGTHYCVFLSPKYVVRIREKGQEILHRETDLLKALDHPLIPNIIQSEKEERFSFMVENRLPGSNTNLEWKKLAGKEKDQIIKDINEFLDTIHQKEGSFFYDIQQGEQHNDLLSSLLKEAEEKIHHIEKTENYRQARDLLIEFKKRIKNEKAREKLEETKTPRLVHGDMIIHNLLTDGEKLSGVIDWELARWGDPDYDIARLMYYQECARSYYHQGKDDSFEYDFLNKLLTSLENKINREEFELKYIFYRSLFYLGALVWAVNSDSPGRNIKELEDDWKK